MGWFRSKRYPTILFVLYVLAFIWSAYKPAYLQDFILETVLAFLLVLFLFLTRKKFPLSNLSYTLIFVFLIMHTIGAHYTYSEVPYETWGKAILGISINAIFGFTRNNFDRLVHFSFGLLFAYPIRELFMRVANTRGVWSYYLPFDVVASFSAIYELIEWFAALAFGGDLGAAYLGTQGDVWDAQKDMAMAMLGALFTMIITFFINMKYKKGFGNELKESLSVKRKEPLGEVELRKMMKR